MLERYKEDLNQFIATVESKSNNGDQIFENELSHIDFYHSHSKQELLDYIDNYTKNNIVKDDYDFIYMMRNIIKYMSNNLDMGTTISFPRNNLLPFHVKFIDDSLFVDAKDFRYNKSRIKAINGVSVSKLVREIGKCITYGTTGGYETKVEKFLLSINNILSLPPIDSESKKLTFTTVEGNFEVENVPHRLEHIEYEKYLVNNHTLIFKYPFCKEECAPDIQKIEKLVKLYQIENFVLDLRGNYGGSANVTLPLIKYLKQNHFNLTTIVDKSVSFSGQLAMMDMKRMGSKIIGEDIGTQINYFGYCYSNGTLKNTDFKYSLSRVFLYYDEKNFRMNGIFTKKELDERKDEVLKLRYLKLDKEIMYTKDDFMYDKDPVLEYINNNVNSLSKR